MTDPDEERTDYGTLHGKGDSMAKKKRMPQAEYEAAIDLLLHLRARFPNVISRPNQQHGRRPLKIGIRDDLAALFPKIEPQTIGQALKIYTLHSGYLRALVEGAPRMDLNGAEVGSVTAEVAGHARSCWWKSDVTGTWGANPRAIPGDTGADRNGGNAGNRPA
jgi:ProP effector